MLILPPRLTSRYKRSVCGHAAPELCLPRGIPPAAGHGWRNRAAAKHSARGRARPRQCAAAKRSPAAGTSCGRAVLRKMPSACGGAWLRQACCAMHSACGGVSLRWSCAAAKRFACGGPGCAKHAAQAIRLRRGVAAPELAAATVSPAAGQAAPRVLRKLVACGGAWLRRSWLPRPFRLRQARRAARGVRPAPGRGGSLAGRGERVRPRGAASRW
jgi:hypothetical protein